MVRSLNTLALLGGLVAALPAPTPTVTPPPDLSKRQVVADGCTITFNSASAFEQTLLSGDGSGRIITSISTIPLPAGNGCNCDNGVVAGISESVGNDGQTTQYCATGDSTDPQSTVVAAPTPGAADNAGWAQVRCTDGSLTDVFENPWLQWNDSGAAGAWNSMKEQWDVASDDERESLSNFVGNYFKTKPSSWCENLGEGSCEDTIQCGQLFDGGDATTPAGYVLFNSMVGVHHEFKSLYTSINDALGFAAPRLGTFVETMSPINEDIQDQKRQKIAFDVAQACMFGVLAPTFHSGFSRNRWVKDNPNVVAAAFDFTYGMIGTSFAIAKDAMQQLSTTPITDSMSTFMVETATGWLEAVTDTARGVLNDPDNTFLFIDQGKFFPGEAPDDPIDAASFMEKNFLAAALSAVWVTGDPSAHSPPVIVLSDDVPQDGTGCESYNPEDWEYPGDGVAGDLNFKDDVLTGALTCIGDTAYWLMGARIDEDAGGCFVPGTSYPSDCPINGVRFDPLYNLDKLGDFNLTKEEVVGNAVNSWAANGNANGWDPLELADVQGDEIGDLIEQNLGATKGIVKIPVCSFNDLMTYLNEDPDSDGADNPNHPCPP